jgi:putative salt-induced outer membrane protein YdiY
MRMKKLFYYFIILSFLAVSPALSVAGDQADLGDWWNKSAKSYDPVPNELLHHFELSYSFAKGSGNRDSENHNGKASLTLRKNIFTSETKYSIRESELSSSLAPADTISSEVKIFNQEILAAVTKSIDILAGYRFASNDITAIDSRNVFYGGFAWQYSVESIGISGNLGLSGGYSTSSYTDFVSKALGTISVDDYETPIIRLSQALNWKITDNISFSDNIFYMSMLKDTEYFFSKMTFSLNFKINKYLSFFTSYNIDYDSNPRFEAIDTALKNAGSAAAVYDKDTRISTGIKLSF